MNDLMLEKLSGVSRKFSGADEIRWARDYEISLLPPTTVFPRHNQIWAPSEACEVDVDCIFATPSGLSSKGILGKGERVRILGTDFHPKPLVVDFLPIRYDDLHEMFVPSEIRCMERYTNYVLTVRILYFNEHFELLETLPNQSTDPAP